MSRALNPVLDVRRMERMDAEMLLADMYSLLRQVLPRVVLVLGLWITDDVSALLPRPSKFRISNSGTPQVLAIVFWKSRRLGGCKISG